MGTSTSNAGTSGNGTPLVPSWLDPGSSDVGDTGSANESEGNSPQTEKPPVPEPADSNRYQAPRTAFSKFARSGGSDRRSMGRAVSSYVSRSSGGSRGAVQKMGSSRGTAARLLNFLNDAATRGIDETLRSLNLDNLTGKPIDEVFIGIADYILPEGGSADTGIARDAFVQTIAQVVEAGSVDLADLSSDQVQAVIEAYTTNSIELRIYNEIGTKAVSMPKDVAAATAIQDQLHDFIGNGVSEAFNNLDQRPLPLRPDETLAYVDQIYEQAFDLLVALGDNMENEE